MPAGPLQASKTLEEKAEGEQGRAGRSRRDGETLPSSAWSETSPGQGAEPRGQAQAKSSACQRQRWCFPLQTSSSVSCC